MCRKAGCIAKDKIRIIFIIIKWSMNRKLNKNKVYVSNKNLCNIWSKSWQNKVRKKWIITGKSLDKTFSIKISRPKQKDISIIDMKITINILGLYRMWHSNATFFQKSIEHLPQLTGYWAVKQILTNFKRLKSQSTHLLTRVEQS